MLDYLAHKSYISRWVTQFINFSCEAVWRGKAARLLSSLSFLGRAWTRRRAWGLLPTLEARGQFSNSWKFHEFENATEILNYEAFGLLYWIRFVDGMRGLGSRSISSGPLHPGSNESCIFAR